jgi:hypothetical protein
VHYTVRDSDAGVETSVLELLSKRPLYSAEDREEATTVSSLLSHIAYTVCTEPCA